MLKIELFPFHLKKNEKKTELLIGGMFSLCNADLKWLLYIYVILILFLFMLECWGLTLKKR